MIPCAIIIAICLILVLAMRGRTGHPEMKRLCAWTYAHRGVHGNGVPENSIEAFRIAKSKEYGIELDVHLLSDGKLAVIHDSCLKRTTGIDGSIEDLTADQLQNYHLDGTEQTIPLLDEVLKLVNGQTPLIIELKSTVANYADLCEKTCDLLETYSGLYCIESFDPRCIVWLKKHRKHIIRGQLAENYFKIPGCKVPFILKLILANHLMNFLSMPDFIAYRYTDRRRFVNWVCKKVWRLSGFAWTVDSKEDCIAVVNDGWIPIFEGFDP